MPPTGWPTRTCDKIMLYDVTLRIDYTYSHPRDQTRNLLRLLPIDIPNLQRIPEWKLALTPLPSERYGFVDFFGNNVTSAAWHSPIEEVKISLSFRAERLTEPARFMMSPDIDRLGHVLASLRDATPLSPLHFTTPTRRAPIETVMTNFAHDHLAPGLSALDAVQAIGRAIHYRPRPTRSAASAGSTPTPRREGGHRPVERAGG